MTDRSSEGSGDLEAMLTGLKADLGAEPVPPELRALAQRLEAALDGPLSGMGDGSRPDPGSTPPPEPTAGPAPA